MFDSVQLVRDICEKRGIPISKLEKECGFGNGYLNNKNRKIKKMPYDRAQIIGNYLGISAEYILTGEKNKKASALTEKDGRDIAKDLEQIMAQLDAGGDLMFDGDPMSDEAIESIKSAMKLGLEAAKVKNKDRFTPKQYRKE